jgi:hypothetical protein
MPQTRTLIELPAPVDLERMDPAIAAAATIEILRIPAPEEFKRYKEDDLADLGKRDRKTILRLAEMEQWMNWMVGELQNGNTHARQLEAERIRLALEVEKMKCIIAEHSWKISVAKWFSMASVAGLIGALLKWCFDRVGK